MADDGDEIEIRIRGWANLVVPAPSAWGQMPMSDDQIAEYESDPEGFLARLNASMTGDEDDG
jgi:hypothetical protein